MKPSTMQELAQRLLDGRLGPRDYDFEAKVAGALMYAARELQRRDEAQAKAAQAGAGKSRAELLSLADELDGYDCGRDEAPGRAAALLRELAELRPVAWRGHGVITGQPFAVMNKESCSDDCGPWLALHDLSDVLTDD